MNRFLSALSLTFLLPLMAHAQGVLIVTSEPVPLPRPIIPPRPAPNPPRATYCLNELSLQATISDQIADVQVSQTFENTGATTIEAQFVFPLPYDGAIDEMTLLVNGKELNAKLLSAPEAKERYESIVRRNRDPALLEWLGTGMFQTSVFPIPAGEKRTVSIHYSQLLRHDHSLTDFLFPLHTARYTSKPVDKVSIRVSIKSSMELKNLYSPSHAVNIARNGEKSAVVTYEATQTVPDADFRLLFDSRQGMLNATLLSYRPDPKEDGYFLLLCAPEVVSRKTTHPLKTISLVVDKSGSMSGQKIEQVRGAARFMLHNLHDGDLFNIVSYDGQVSAFRPELAAFDGQSRADGLAYVDGLYAGGATNIHDALLRALHELKDRQRPNYVLFLTDGLPTTGETNESRIAKAAREANAVGARLLAFGVGFDVNSRLLDRLSRENHGLSEYVRPDEDIEAHVSRVLERISSPVLTDIALTIETERSSASATNRIYPTGRLDLFAGEQLVVVGRYKNPGAANIRLNGRIDGQEQTHTFPGNLDSKSSDQTNSFVAKLWATRRIGEIIDELDLNGSNEELVQELVSLSTKYGILTPYTSFLANETAKPELSSTVNLQRTNQSLEALAQPGGRRGFEQRDVKQMFKNANQAPAAASGFGLAEPSDEFRKRSDPTADGKPVLVQKGEHTIYRRGKLLVTPETAGLDVEKDQAKFQVIDRFTPEYFAIVAKNSKTENELLSEQQADEEFLVTLQGQVYLIK